MEKHSACTSDKRLSRIPWNKGKLIGAKPPLRPSHVCLWRLVYWPVPDVQQTNVKQPALCLARFSLSLINVTQGGECHA
jgi:hypothetical protein